MTDTDTSAEVVERLARAMEARVIETYGGHGTVLEMADDGCNAAAATLRALLSERDAARAEAERLRAEATKLRHAWLRVIQQENSCPASGGGCLAKQCGCVAEMEMLIKEGDARHD